MRSIGVIRSGARALVGSERIRELNRSITRKEVSDKDQSDQHQQSEVVKPSSFKPKKSESDHQSRKLSVIKDFSGRVHSESYSQQNLSAAFQEILDSNQSDRSKTLTVSDLRVKDEEDGFNLFRESVRIKTLDTIKDYQASILNSLSLEDPSGRLYSKNVRQMKEILSFEKWRRSSSCDSKDKTQRSKEDDTRVRDDTDLDGKAKMRMIRREVFDRPSIVDRKRIRDLIFNFWKLDRMTDLTILVSYSGHPFLIDELLKLKNVKKVIAIEEFPEYCTMYTDRYDQEVKRNRFYHIKNDGYWWESYSEVEDLGLLDDLDIMPFDKRHESFFFLCQLPHLSRSIQFMMQIISLIPLRSWLFQYGNFNMSFICSGKLFNKVGRRRNDKKYSRINATLNCLVDYESYNDRKDQEESEDKKVTRESVVVDGDVKDGTRLLGSDSFFPNRWIETFEESDLTKVKGEEDGMRSTTGLNDQIQDVDQQASTIVKIRQRRRKVPKKSLGKNRKTTRLYKSTIDPNSLDFADSILIRPKTNLSLSEEEFDCLIFLQKMMFVHSASSWVDSISHVAAGASIMYDRLRDEGREISRSKSVRELSDEDWIDLCRCFNQWPFKPTSFENDLELDLDESN